jgi:erythromycin esterase
MYRGVITDHLRAPYRVGQPRAGGLEAILHQAPWRYSFVDFSSAKRERGSEWMWSALDALEMGRQADRIVPRNAYDAVLFIDEVHPPTYR